MATDQFFAGKKAAAVLKHEILNQYLSPFASMAGHFSTGHRVAFVDGYAGPGRYEDGSEGSPAVALRTAHALAGFVGDHVRHLECHFVEAGKNEFEGLVETVRTEGHGLTVTTRRGKVEEHLAEILDAVAGIPVFVFLDPFGVVPPFDLVKRIFDRPGHLGAPATEVLLNFSSGVRRVAGLLHKDVRTPTEEHTLATLDGVCGGDWWRSTWLQHAPSKKSSDDQRSAAERAVVGEYARRLGHATNASSWTVPVRNRQRYMPAYWLVFLTRHQDGVAKFGDSLSLGLEKWRRYVHEQDHAGTLFAEGWVQDDEENRLRAEWIDAISANIRRLLTTAASFRPIDRYAEVMGAALGSARELHLRAAIKSLYAAGATTSDGKGKNLFHQPIVRA